MYTILFCILPMTKRFTFENCRCSGNIDRLQAVISFHGVISTYNSICSACDGFRCLETKQANGGLQNETGCLTSECNFPPNMRLSVLSNRPRYIFASHRTPTRKDKDEDNSLFFVCLFVLFYFFFVFFYHERFC